MNAAWTLARIRGAPERLISGEMYARMRGACRQIFGIPDYDRYLEHMAKRHPGDAVLSRREFFACAIDRKYSRSGPRCC